MKKLFTKFTMLLIALTISTSLMAQSYSGGSGTSGDPYQIANKTDLRYLSEHSTEWAKYFIQTANIAFVSSDFLSGGDFYNGGEGFIPIGNVTTKFTGEYNGDGYTIDALYISRSSTNYQGLFGMADGANIENIGVTNVEITGNTYTGGLIGYIYSLETVSNCYSTGSVSGNADVGGLVGYNVSSTISNSYSTASVGGGGSNVGGLVGKNRVSLIISNSYSTGSVSGNTNVGGLVGYNITSTISNSYSTGSVSGNGLYVGGLIGVKGSSTITNSFWDITTSGQSGSDGGTGKITTQMKTQSTFTYAGWDFTTPIWSISSSYNSGYPNLDGVVFVHTWDGSESTAWNTAANWVNDILPTSTYNDVVIADVANDPIIASGVGASCNNLTINSGAILTINSGGSLITAGAITNNGTVSVKPSISDGQWHLISSPIIVATANVFDGEYLQTWNEASATWAYITEPAAALTLVKGYSLWGIAKSNTTYTFTGTPNTGNQSIALTASGSGNFTGANLVGNPYPSSIDWATVSGYGAVYYWNGTAYLAYPETSGYGTGSQYIPPMQGFFIVPGAGTFSLTNANRTHSGATAFYKSTNKLPANSIMLAASGNNYTDELFIRFDEESSENFELQNDAYKFLSSTDGLSQLYSTNINNDMLSIDVRPACNVIQLGFQNNTNGNYSINIVEMDGMSAVSLEDTKTNTMHNFADGAYYFDYTITDAETRFKLHMQAAGIGELFNELTNIYAHNNIIYVKSKYNINNGDVKVYDVTGRVVAQQSISNNNFVSIPANFKTGMYIVVVNTGAGITSDKVIIK